MSTLPFYPFARLFTLALSLLIATMVATVPAAADVVTLKSGEKIEGKIIAEGTDMVRIEVQVSGSIKETKTYGMADVANIEKTAPDKVAFAGIKANIPTPDLMSSADYDDMIRSSARRFLTTFPESEHVAEVEAIIKQLEEEKEKVQLGAIKLDGEWISREERQLYRFAIEARIRNQRMKSKMANKDILGALREFEVISERYEETPAHAAALRNAVKVLPAWIQNLVRQLSNVQFLNDRDEAQSKNLKADELAQIQQAKAAEQARFAQALKNEQAQGILWTSVNFRSAESLENGISLAKAQLTQLRAIDVAELEKQAEILTEANRLIGEGQISAARGKIAEATGASSSKSKRSSSRSKDSAAATRYSQWLLGQISEKEQALEDAAKAAAEAKKNSTATIVSDKDDKDDKKDGAKDDKEMADKKDGDGADEGEDKGKGEDEAKEDAKPKTRAEILAAERARSEAKRAAEGSDEKSKPKRPAPKKSDDKDEEEDKDDKPARVSSGGGFNPMYIVWGIAGLLIITVIVMKVTGIGGGGAGGGK